MRKQAILGAVWDAVNPMNIADSMGKNFWNMGTAIEEGRLGSGLWSGLKGTLDGAAIIPVAGLLGKGVSLAGKGVTGLGKAIKGAPGATGLFRRTTGSTLSGSGRLANWTGSKADNFGNAFNKRIPGGPWAPAAAGLGVGAAEMGHAGLANKLNQWTAPLAPSAQVGADYMNTARGYLQPSGNPLHSGFNPRFGQ